MKNLKRVTLSFLAVIMSIIIFSPNAFAATKMIINKDDTKVYATVSTDSKVIMVLNKGDEVTKVIGNSSHYKIKAIDPNSEKEFVGYILIDNATDVDKSSITPKPKSTAKPSTTKQAKKQSNTVYFTPNGKSYHSTKGCRSLARSKTIKQCTLDEAKSKKLSPCKNCAR